MSVGFQWWLLIEALGLAGTPLAVAVFRNLPDRGWALAKPLSLLTLGWLIWLPLSTFPALPFSRTWIVGTALVFVAGNAALLRLKRVREPLGRLLRTGWGYIALAEATFAAAFVVMLWERSFTPAVVDTEKFMDVAFLSAIWRAPHLPPPDPWLSGYTLNYYYYGHYLMALIAKLLGTVPAVAFNLAVAMIFALAASAIFGVAANLAVVARRGAGARWSGLGGGALAGGISVALTLVAGNLAGAQSWWKGALAAAASYAPLHGNPWAWWTHRELWPTFDWWAPSRVIPNTINEFPAFSFVLADLHAHVLALPFATLAVGLALNLLLARGRGLAAFGGRLWPVGLVVCAVALGGLYPINGWDLPTYLGIALLALALQQWLAGGRTFTITVLLDFAGAALTLIALAFLAYLPFYLNFSSPAQGIGLVPPASRSPIGDVWAIFALPALLALSYLALQLGAWIKYDAAPAVADAWHGSAGTRLRDRLGPVPVAFVGGVPLAALAALTALTRSANGWTLLWSLLIVMVCVALIVYSLFALERRVHRGDLMLTLLVGCGAGLVMICELVYLRDVFGGPLLRMNTVFKFYYQAWLILGIISGPLLVRLMSGAIGAIRAAVSVRSQEEPSGARLDAEPALATVAGSRAPTQPTPPESQPVVTRVRTRKGWRRVTGVGALTWALAVGALLVAALIYPTLAVAARSDNLSLSHSLDGTAFMQQDATDMGDASAIAWLNAHVSGDPVIVEAARYDEYTHLGRVSAFTGMPTLLGWGGHEVQWRYNWLARPGNGDVLSARLDAVTQIYTNPDDGAVLALLHEYHVSYLYVGAAERERYPTANLTRFGGFLRTVYHDAHVTIYAV